MPMTVLKVSQLNRYVKSLLDSNQQLREILVRGEITNLSARGPSGHLYFSLKDADAAVRCVMFSNNAAQLRFFPENSLSVVARGAATLYERDGGFQLYVAELIPDGAGALGVAYEQLKRRLAADGLFDEGRKRPLPAFPSVIGVATSATGAAIHDIQSVLQRRYPAATLLLAPTAVQGPAAARSIAGAIERLNADGRSDLLIVGRGGGSAEELWAFNEEETVRAVAGSRIPVISAVGHESDVTLCDLAADLRAATPTAAAELAAPDIAQLRFALGERSSLLYALIHRRMERSGERLAALKRDPALMNPTFFIDKNRQRLHNLIESLYNLSEMSLDGRGRRLSATAALLDSLSPLKVLARGYSITEREGRPVLSSDGLRPGDTIITRLADGRIHSTVAAIEGEKDS